MNQTSTETTPQQPSLDGTTLDQRVAIVHEQIKAESAQPAGEAPEGENPVPPAEAAAEPPSPADSADPAADRRARLDALRQGERDKQERNAKRAEQDRLARELAEARKRAEDLEAVAAKRVDLDGLDEAAFFRLAQERGIKPEKLGAWIRESMANPERVAEAAAAEAARKAVDPKLSAVEKELAELRSQLADERAHRARAQAAQTEQQAANEFIEFTKAQGQQSPYASRFLDKRGPDAFYALALRACEAIPEGSGYQAVLDHIEENLSAFADVYSADTPSKAASTPPKKTAAAKATTTLSNAIASERASIAEDEDFASLPLEERARRIVGAR